VPPPLSILAVCKSCTFSFTAERGKTILPLYRTAAVVEYRRLTGMDGDVHCLLTTSDCQGMAIEKLIRLFTDLASHCGVAGTHVLGSSAS